MAIALLLLSALICLVSASPFWTKNPPNATTGGFAYLSDCLVPIRAPPQLSQLTRLARFECPRPAAPLPEAQNVRQVHPSHIRMIASLGDSITAGLFMDVGKIPLALHPERRSKTYSNGGGPGVLSLGTLLDYYQPPGKRILGLSTNNTFVYTQAGSGLNVAVTGVASYELDPQVDVLIRRLRDEDPYRAEFQTGWKMINIWIGALDLCRNATTIDDYERSMLHTLDRIRAAVPRVLVNLVAFFPLDEVYDAIQSSLYCRFIQRLANMCAIIFAPPSMEARQDFAHRTRLLNARLEKIAQHYNQLQDDQFNVIAQTGLERLNIGALKRNSYLANVDW